MGVFGGVLWGLPPFPSDWESLMLPVRVSPWPPPRPPPRPRRPRWSGCLRDVLGFALKEIRQYLNQKSIIQNIIIAKNNTHSFGPLAPSTENLSVLWPIYRQCITGIVSFVSFLSCNNNFCQHTAIKAHFLTWTVLLQDYTVYTGTKSFLSNGLLMAVTGSLRGTWDRSVRFMLV